MPIPTNDYDNIRFNDPNVPFSYAVRRTIQKNDIPHLRIPRWHEQMEFKLILSGSAEISCGSMLFLAQKGDLVVINPCELHGISPVGEEKLEYHLLMISPNRLYSEQMEPLLSGLTGGNLRFRNHICGNTRAHELFFSLFDELSEKNTGYELASVGYFSLLFTELLRKERSEIPQNLRYDELNRHAKKLEPALRMIGEHYAGDLVLEDLAEACGKSVYHFCRIFKQVTGQTVIGYLNDYRINKAELLIRSTELPMGDISSAVGFTDPSYFARYFKKIKGISPSECREKSKK